jgi:hypothetical protein
VQHLGIRRDIHGGGPNQHYMLEKWASSRALRRWHACELQGCCGRGRDSYRGQVNKEFRPRFVVPIGRAIGIRAEMILIYGAQKSKLPRTVSWFRRT